MSAKLGANRKVYLFAAVLVFASLVLIEVRMILGWSWMILPVPAPDADLITNLLMIPIGTLVVAFFRNVVGLLSFDVFSPIILAFVFRQLSLSLGLVGLTLLLLGGWILRKFLDGFKLLLIPKISLIGCAVTFLVILLIWVTSHLNPQSISSIYFFPWVMMIWVVERFTFIQMESGIKSALSVTAETVAVATVIYLFYHWLDVNWWLLVIAGWPESLLMILAILLLLGRYNAIRLIELWRFRDLIKEDKKNRPDDR